MWDYTEKYPVLLEEKESDGTIVRYTYAGNRERVHADVTQKATMPKHRVTVCTRTDSEAQDGHWMKMQRLQRKQSMMPGESRKQKR